MNQWYIAYARIYVSFTACNSFSSANYAALPLPLVDPRAIPLPLVPRVAPPRVGIPPLPRAVGMPLPLPAAAGVFFGVGAGLATFLNLLAAFELGGLSTKDVSVVRKVASTSSMPEARRAGRVADGFRPGWFCGRLNESGTGACPQSVRQRHVVQAHSVLLLFWKRARAEAAGSTHLGEIHTKGVHVHAVQEPGEALAEARKALVHQLQLHKVLLQVGHGVAQLGEPVLQALERIRGRGIARALCAVAERAA